MTGIIFKTGTSIDFGVNNGSVSMQPSLGRGPEGPQGPAAPLAVSYVDNLDGTGTLSISGSAFVSATDNHDGTTTLILETS